MLSWYYVIYICSSFLVEWKQIAVKYRIITSIVEKCLFKRWRKQNIHRNYLKKKKNDVHISCVVTLLFSCKMFFRNNIFKLGAVEVPWTRRKHQYSLIWVHTALVLLSWCRTLIACWVLFFQPINAIVSPHRMKTCLLIIGWKNASQLEIGILHQQHQNKRIVNATYYLRNIW